MKLSFVVIALSIIALLTVSGCSRERVSSGLEEHEGNEIVPFSQELTGTLSPYELYAFTLEGFEANVPSDLTAFFNNEELEIQTFETDSFVVLIPDVDVETIGLFEIRYAGQALTDKLITISPHENLDSFDVSDFLENRLIPELDRKLQATPWAFALEVHLSLIRDLVEVWPTLANSDIELVKKLVLSNSLSQLGAWSSVDLGEAIQSAEMCEPIARELARHSAALVSNGMTAFVVSAGTRILPNASATSGLSSSLLYGLTYGLLVLEAEHSYQKAKETLNQHLIPYCYNNVIEETTAFLSTISFNSLQKNYLISFHSLPEGILDFPMTALDRLSWRLEIILGEDAVLEIDAMIEHWNGLNEDPFISVRSPLDSFDFQFDFDLAKVGYQTWSVRPRIDSLPQGIELSYLPFVIEARASTRFGHSVLRAESGFDIQ